MAHISGSFSDPRAGTLHVFAAGIFFQGTARDAGFASGSSNVLIAGLIQGVALPAMDRNAPTSYMAFEYPGGNANWSIQTYEIAHVYGGGTATYGFKNLKIDLLFVAR